MKKLFTGVAAVSFCALASSVSAGTVEEDATAFGARQSIFHASLSPSGKKLAYVGTVGAGGEALYTVDLEAGTPPKRALAALDPMSDLSYCNWITEERLVCQTILRRKDDSIGRYIAASRMISVNADGTDPNVIEGRKSMRAYGNIYFGGGIISLNAEGEESSVLVTRGYVKESSLNTRLANQAEGLGVVSHDVVTGKERPVEAPDKDAFEYIADDAGIVRIKGTLNSNPRGYAQDTLAYFYREQGSKRWNPLSRAEIDSQTIDGFEPYAVDSATNAAIGFDNDDRGFKTLYAISLDGTLARKELLAAEGADVDSLVTIGRRQRVIGASYATEKRLVKYFDPAFRDLAGALSGALPGKPAVSFVGASEDERQVLLVTGSDVDPGMLYKFDRDTNQLNPLLPIRETTEGHKLAEMKPVVFPAADGTQIPGYLTLPVGSTGKNLPAIVLPHGGPSARDEWGFDWLVQFFAARGYAVLQPNFRGSTGYGAEWFGKNGVKAWRTAIGDVNDAGRWLVSQGIAKPDKMAIVGWSYGGYTALQSQVVDADLYKAVVAIAPVADWRQYLEEERTTSNYRLVQKFVGDGPYLEQGSPMRNAAAFEAPVLLVHGTADNNVDVEQSRNMEDALRAAGKPVEFLEFEGLAHSLHDGAARKQMLVKIDSFLSANLGS
ncbi:S9 family peptidase [Qipengyuania sp. YG27]|uniref:S9 family peptidase n=1 Tax=Qipengyuania mesophila TaxID=2867246 RepID=A0ABS7JY91_9SPHN|nr:S9 family peptidase [Qipengyuania mesophila]MBX7502624.1 S9 family peptidase [Qipengyuania mesophila]